MPAFQSPLPTRGEDLPWLWLFTDARAQARLDGAITALPPGSGIVFRHYHLPEAERRALFTNLMQRHAAADRIWLWSGNARTAQALDADGVYAPAHGPQAGPVALRRGLWLAAVHDLAELAMAARRGADAVFISPVYPTRSHPGAATLGPMRFAAIARLARCPVYALGGVTHANHARLARFSSGWGAIDGLSERGG
ncbi:MAG: thiamine phosphate synthase [Pseudomonadota bacterium]